MTETEDPDKYAAATENLDKFGEKLVKLVEELLASRSIVVSQITYRVKSRSSTYKKLQSNPAKYRVISDLTDLLGVRIVTFFPNQVDTVGQIKDEFKVDDTHSVDKRLALDYDRFGYLSLHHVATLNEARATLCENAIFANTSAEFQVRSILQHVWAEIEHDLGYKAESTVPEDVRRRFSRLAGLLEIADTEFQAIRDQQITYTARVGTQVKISLGNLLLDRISITAYISNSPTISDTDGKLAQVFRTRLQAENDVSAWVRLFLR